MLNLSNISSDLGISSVTLKEWLSILEASYVVFLLKPFYTKLSKQLIKSPKLYFTDTGLVCYLLGIDNPNQLKSHPLRGNIFENLIVIEILKSRINKGKIINLNYYRDKHKEVDLIYKIANKFALLEIKSSETFNKEFIGNLTYLENLLSKQIIDKALVYCGSESYEMNQTKIINLESLNNYLQKVSLLPQTPKN